MSNYKVGFIVKKFKEISLSKLATYMLGLYIITLFTFVHNSDLIILSEFVLILYAGVTILNIVKKRSVKYHFSFAILGSLLFISLLSSFWSIDQNLAIETSARLFQFFTLLFLVYNTINDKNDISICFRGIFIGGLIMCLISLFIYGFEEIYLSLLHGYRLAGDMNQANIFGYLSSLTFIVAIFYFFKYRKWYYYIISLLPLIFVITSGSRRAMLIVLISFFLLMIINNVIQRKKFKGIVYLGLFILVGSYLLERLMFLEAFTRLNTLLSLFNRESGIESSLIERQQMIDFGWGIFEKNPLLGVGANQYRAWYFLDFGQYRPAHNGFIQNLVDYGLIGFILYYSLFIYLIIKLCEIILKHAKLIKVKSIGYEGLLFITIVVILFSDIATNSIYDKLTYVLLALGLAFVNSTKIKHSFHFKLN